ncbi:SOS response-associated peptidase [Alkaliphilus serpentinus]|uniref:Abasic site processing protein n=1 Tax=Alkaliphilus serpentinus TaxID=1482731 RepID=A0A833MEM4_9FIRM|nr:SOS response-associated peptidase [Alkaliphilus serpentinus]KAB3531504.1 SOS response-associated peptidase [Alkaliphilus serpentinus]
MCGRFFFEGDLEEVIRKFAIEEVDDRSREYGEIFPSNEFPIVINKKQNILAHYRWGFSAPFLKNIIINARLETIDTKPMFKGAFKERRCVIPVSYYFEWKAEEGKKVKHKIFMKSEKHFYLAGLYGSFHDKKGEAYNGFTIITTNPLSDLAHIHDRMPLILKDDQLELWLDSTIRDIDMLKEMVKERINLPPLLVEPA